MGNPSLSRNILNWLREVSIPVLVYLLLNLTLMALALVLSQPSVRIGTLRPVGTIPLKLLELALLGASLGIVASVVERKLDIYLISLGAAFVLLLDLDHLPSVLGIEQPVRPDHTIFFLTLSFTLLLLTTRGKYEVPVISASAFAGHLAADTGIFAIYAPFSFQYVTLSDFRLQLLLLSILLALMAGFIRHKRQTGEKISLATNLRTQSIYQGRTSRIG
jgi:hypothetical protein